MNNDSASGVGKTPAITPLFSIVMACRNSEAHLRQALDSVLAQTCQDFELVVVDGASEDGTLDIIREYEPRFMERMRWVSEPDGGIYDAMNKGLALACGRYIAYLGSDDLLEPDALDIVSAAIDESEAEIICGETIVFSDETSWHESCRPHKPGTLPLRLPSRHQSVFVSTAAMRSIGGFDLRYRIAADYDLYVRLVQSGARVVCVPQVLSRFRLGGLSSSNTLKTARQYRDIRVSHGSPTLLEQARLVKALVGSKIFSAGVRWRQ